jgi:hypothetical protein
LRRSPPYLAVALAGLLAGRAAAVEPEPEPEPAVCVEVEKAHPGEEIAALRGEEIARWREARQASRDGRRLMQRALGLPQSPQSRRLMAEYEQANVRYIEAVHAAQALCRCRERRGDARPEECVRLHPAP